VHLLARYFILIKMHGETTIKKKYVRVFISLEITYPRLIRRRSNLCHIFLEKSVSYGPGNMVFSSSINFPLLWKPNVHSRFTHTHTHTHTHHTRARTHTHTHTHTKVFIKSHHESSVHTLTPDLSRSKIRRFLPSCHSPLSYTLAVCTSVKVRNQVSHSG
jgi:hypothetical protein